LKDVLEKLQKLSDRMPAAVRRGIADKMGAAFATHTLKPEDRTIAEEIFRVLAHDVEVQVRQALAEQLKDSSLLPRDVAMTLAKDLVASISDPMLEFSAVLSDEDLLDVLKHSQTLSSQMSIARRASVNEPVARALVATGQPEVTNTLISNQGAVISEDVVEDIARTFPENRELLQHTIQRYPLPLPLAERIVSHIAAHLREEIMASADFSSFAIEDALSTIQEWATVQMMVGASEKELIAFVDHLYKEAKLTPSLLVRALVHGHVRFFEAAVARRAQVPMRNVHTLMRDPGPLGFKAVYKAATLPPGVAEPLRLVFQHASKITRDGRDDVPDFSKKLLDRIMAQGEHGEIENMDFIIALIARSMATEHGSIGNLPSRKIAV
jgi:uncharacterized protein (DUF2336 family)